MTTRADCLAGVCPCSQPEYPGDDHRCPPDPRSIDERERDHDPRPFEPWEGETAAHAAYGGTPVTIR